MSALPDSFFCAGGVIKLKLAFTRGLGKYLAVDEPKGVALFIPGVVRNLRQDGPARVHFLFDVAPHRFRFGDMSVGV